jgi:hypothetical protein
MDYSHRINSIMVDKQLEWKNRQPTGLISVFDSPGKIVITALSLPSCVDDKQMLHEGAPGTSYRSVARMLS